MQTFTSTSLNQYNSCPRRYYYEYFLELDKYSPTLIHRDSEPLIFGSHAHRLLEQYHTRGSYSSDGVPTRLCPAMIALMDAYVRKNEFSNEPKLEFIATEQELGVHLITDAGEFKLLGKVDGIVEYLGRTWVLDNKTSTFELKDTDKYLLHQQTNIYCCLAEANGIDKIEGTIINFLRQPTLSRVDKRKKIQEIVSDDQFRQRIYDDILKREDTYLKRVELPRVNGEVREAIKDVIDLISHIKLSETSGYWRKNPAACNEYRSACEWQPLCLSIFTVDEIPKRQVKHVELKASEITCPVIDWRTKKYEVLF